MKNNPFKEIFEKENFTKEDCEIWLEAIKNKRVYLIKSVGYYLLCGKNKRNRRKLKKSNYYK